MPGSTAGTIISSLTRPPARTRALAADATSSAPALGDASFRTVSVSVIVAPLAGSSTRRGSLVGGLGGGSRGPEVVQQPQRRRDDPLLRVGMERHRYQVVLEQHVRDLVPHVDVPTAGRIVLGARQVHHAAIRVAE